MIKGLYEAHLPVSNLRISVEFYRKLGLELCSEITDTSKVAFFWVEKGKSWIGLWENDEAVSTKYHPSLRHLAFRVELDDLKKAKLKLRENGIELRGDFGLDPIEPIVMPYNGHAMIYLNDPDGNSVELITYLEKVSENHEIMYLSEWEETIGSNQVQ
ncbi:VOC family protein [Fredinandcohnia humi]